MAGAAILGPPARLVEGRFFDVSPLPREPKFHHRVIDRGQHCRHRVVGDARGVRRGLLR
jgi:hypothetical protein